MLQNDNKANEKNNILLKKEAYYSYWLHVNQNSWYPYYVLKSKNSEEKIFFVKSEPTKTKVISCAQFYYYM